MLYALRRTGVKNSSFEDIKFHRKKTLISQFIIVVNYSFIHLYLQIIVS